MNDDAKRAFDAWASFRDHAWHQFQEKARVEWRLSFGVWGALLASAGAILGTTGVTRTSLLEWSSIVAVLVLLVVHARFLWWIQQCLGQGRASLREAEQHMLALLEAERPVGPDRGATWKQPSLQVQMAITVLLGAALVFVVHSLPPS